MKKLSLKTILLFTMRVSLACIFIYSSIYKIESPGAFAQQIFNYKLLPPWAINPIAIILPWIQLLCGLLLLLNVWGKEATWLIITMMLVFQTALASALFRNLDVSCGCFKAGGDPATWATFGRDFLILLLGILLQWNYYKKKPPTRGSSNEIKNSFNEGL